MLKQSVTATDEELISIKITGTICKIMSPDKKSVKSCDILEERALLGEISVQDHKDASNLLLKNKGINV